MSGSGHGSLLAKLSAHIRRQGCALAAGALATLPILLGGERVAAVALAASDLHAGVAAGFVNAAVPEESAKLAVLAALLYLMRYLRRWHGVGESARGGARRAIGAGMALGLGFALVEMLVVAWRFAGSSDAAGTLGVTLIRAFTALPLHACIGAVAGCYWSVGSYLKAWALPVALHGIYDLAIFEAARGAGVLGLLVGFAALVLAVFWAAGFYVWSETGGTSQATPSRLPPL